MTDVKVDDLIARGDELMDTGDGADALDAYEQAIAVAPANGEAVAALAFALARLGRKDEGVERLRHATEARAWDTRGLVWLAGALSALDEVGTARRLAREVTEQRKEQWRNDLALAKDLALVWLRLGNAESGLAVINAVGTAIEANAELLWTRGRCLAKLDRHEEALVEYDAALALEGDDARCLLDAATSLRALHRGTEALERARRSRQAGGLDRQRQLELIDLLDALGAESDIAQMLEDASRGDRRGAVELAVGLYTSERPKRAIAVLDGLLDDASWAASDDANEAITWRAVSLTVTGDAPRAVIDFEALDARGARVAEPDQRAMAGIAYLAVGRRDLALAYFDGIADSVGEGLRIPVLLQTGMALVQQGRLSEAIAPLRQASALAAVPGGDPTARGTVALFLAIAVGGEDPDEQVRLLDEADRLLPADDVRGRALLDLKRADLAVGDQRWDDVLTLTDGLAERLEPVDRPTVHFLRGLALARWSRLDEALPEFNEALAAGDLPPSLQVNMRVMRGRLHQARGEYELARADFGKALALTEDPAKQRLLRIWLAGCDLSLGQPETALAALDQLADDDPPAAETAEYWNLRASVLFSLGRSGDGIAATERLAELDPTKQRYARFVRFGAGILGFDWSSLDDAVAELVEAPPADAGALDWLITAFMRAVADRDDASEALDQAARLDPTTYESAFGRQARMLIAESKGDLASFDAAAPADEAQPPAMRSFVHQMRGQIFLARGGGEQQAIDEFAQVAKVAAEAGDPVTDRAAAVALARTAQLHTTLDDIDAARTALDEAERFIARLQDPEPSVLRLLVTMARVPMLLKSEGVDQALDELEKTDSHLELLSPELRAVVEYVRGELLRFQGDEEMALAALRQAAALDPTESSILSSLAAVQTDLGDYDAALATIAIAENVSDKQSKDHQRAHSRRGALRPMDQLQATFEAARQTATYNPNEDHDADLSRLKSIVLRRMGRLEAALEAARQAVSRDPNDDQLWMTLGDAYQALDRLDPATKAYRRAWDLSQDDEHAAARSLVALTRGLILTGQHRVALDAFQSPDHGQRVARIARTYGAVSFNRAVALLRCDDEKQAIHELTAAAGAKYPVPQAADLAGRMARRRMRESSWFGFWFLDRDSGRARRVAGAALLVLLTVTLVVAIANPAEIGWLGWASPDGNHRLIPLVVITALLLLPIVTRLKFGSLEIEQPQPAVTDIPELHPTSADEVAEDRLNTVVHKVTRRVARAVPAQEMPVESGDTSSFERAI